MKQSAGGDKQSRRGCSKLSVGLWVNEEEKQLNERFDKKIMRTKADDATHLGHSPVVRSCRDLDLRESHPVKKRTQTSLGLSLRVP